MPDFNPNNSIQTASLERASFQPAMFSLIPPQPVQQPVQLPQQQQEFRQPNFDSGVSFLGKINPLKINTAMAQEPEKLNENQPGFFSKLYNRLFGNTIKIDNVSANISKPVVKEKTFYDTSIFNIKPREEFKIISTMVSEAGDEGKEGMHAVLSSIINRTQVNPLYYGSSVWDVISKPNQYTGFSVLDPNYKEVLDSLDGKRKTFTPGREEQIKQAQELLELAKSGRLSDAANGATHYFNPNKAKRYPWMDAGEERARVGNHIFLYLYR